MHSRIRVAPRCTVAGVTTKRREATRERLVEAARSLLAEIGIQGATVESICERAGFTRGAFYSNYASKDELILDIFGREKLQMIALMQSAVDSEMGGEVEGVPVLSQSRLVGVLHVGFPVAREFSDTDVAMLRGLADRVAAVTESSDTDRSHDAALVLQRSLLPTTPRRIGGLETAARYVPAEGDLGGDWYDVFALPDGSIGLVMGDVVGHGLPAAVVMGRLRSALRAYALDHADPATVLERLDRKIRHFEESAFATVVYAVVPPPFDTVTISSAGHWPPLLAVPGAEAATVEIVHDPMLGVAEFERQSARMPLPPGSSLCFYTDGLVERRATDDGRLHSVDAQIDVVRRLLSADDDPEDACSRLIASTVGDEFVEDDIALLVVRRSEETLRAAVGEEGLEPPTSRV